MNLTRDMENGSGEKISISLQEFCDMNQLYRILDNWSRSSGMATVIIDTEGNQVSEDFGLTEFCRMVRSSEKGRACCMATWKSDLDGIYECPFGFLDFSVPIVLPDGQVLGKVLAGQALSVQQKDEEILKKTVSLGIDENKVREVLLRVHRKTEMEMQGAYDLLKETLHFFVQKSYSIWKANNELKKVPAKKDRILSQITRIMYGYNLTVDLETERYTLITGTGMERTVEEYQKHNDYKDLRVFQGSVLHPAYLTRFNELTNFESARKNPSENGYRGSLEYPVLYPGDTAYEWHEINVFIDTEEDGRRIANILGRDVTEAHEKADTKAQLEIANAASAAKSAFLFNMSHDIRTPMNAIIGFTELLEKHLDDKELATSYIKKIQTANDFLLSLINNVLEMARIESGKTTLDETYWDAYVFNDTLYSLFDSQMKEKGITFTRTNRVQHPDVICDETKLREIFLNILSNALKYTPSGGTVTMNLTEIPSDIQGYAMYQTVIEDTGIGMSEEFLPHLFEEFTRERSSTESKLNGTGLGMPIVKKLVDLMQGTIEVESKVGKGTKITVTLPHRIAQDGDTPRVIEKGKGYDENCFQGKRILLAEDNALNAEIAITILEEAGFEVEHAEDGIICVDMMEKADAGYYDLILMDIQMPNMDGYKATKTIRKFSDPIKAGITIVAMTANAFEEDKKNAYEAGMNWHIAKPIKVDALMSALTEILKK